MEAVVDRPAAAPRAAEPPPEPVQRWVWQGRYGTIVIEVRGEAVFVNGQHVAPASG